MYNEVVREKIALPPVIIFDLCRERFNGENVVCGKKLLDWHVDDLRAHDFQKIEVIKIESEQELSARLVVIYEEKYKGCEEVFVIFSSGAPAGFLLKEMQNFAAEAVIGGAALTESAADKVVATVKQGRIRKIVTAPTVTTNEQKKLLNVFKLSKSFIKFAKKNLGVSLWEILSLFTSDHVLKVCDLPPDFVERCAKEEDFLRLAKNLLTTVPMTVGDNVYLAPTAVIKGRVIIEEGAKIADFAVIEGGAYLGKNVQVGRFCNVLPGTILEENVQVATYSEIENSYLAPAQKTVARATVKNQVIL
jgi:NDP-sugar pyrophosphorylase family protein